MPMQMPTASTYSSDFLPQSIPTHRCHVYYTGRVQGVGFRYTVKNIAMRFNVGGYVRNLPDGRVELIMEGPGEDVEHLLQAVQARMDGYIREVEVIKPPATGEFSHFHIRH